MFMCFNRRVVMGLGVIALGLLAVSPRLLGSVAPFLLLAVCPLSMVFMMRRGAGHAGSCAVPGERATAASAAADNDAELRNLEEEVNRLRAELHLRDDQRSA